MAARKTVKTSKNAVSALDQGRWLAAALPLLGESGWRHEVFVGAARTLNCDPALVRIVFPRGIKDLVTYFNSWLNEAMLAAIRDSVAFRQMRTKQKVAFAIRARLEVLAPHQVALRQLLIWSASPLHVPVATRCLYEAVNLIWYEAGDTSTDYNFYTKRALAAGVYTSTLLFWLNDTSCNKEATWTFLDARIDDVMQLGQKIGQAKQLGGLAGKFMQAQQRYKRAA